MNNNIPIFIRLRSGGGVEGMLNVNCINCIVPHSDTFTYVYMNRREEPLYVEESYEDIKKKLQNAVWIL